MHPNPAFRGAARERNVEFARQRAFGTLAINAAEGPLLSHIPFLLAPDGARLEAHLVRSNPIVRLLKEGPHEAVIAVTGPDGYISPDWYGVDDQVPTWNYVAVHLRGSMELLPQEELPDILRRISAEMETRLLPKQPWSHDKMTPEVFERMLRQIVPVAMQVGTIDGTWKLSQNKPDEVRLRAADALSAAGIGSDREILARLMADADG